MGRGVVSLGGPVPAARFRQVVERATVGQPRLRAVTFDLLSGRRVRSDDNGVVVAFSGTASRGRLTVRDAAGGARYALVATVRPLGVWELAALDDADPAGQALPVPERWRVVVSEEAQDWELFNCQVDLVVITIA